MVLDRGSLKRESKVLLKTAQVSPYLFTLVLLAIMFVINGISDYVQMDDEFAYVYSLRFDMDLSFLALHRAFPAFAVWFVSIVCTLLGVVLNVGASLYHLGIRRGEEMPFVPCSMASLSSGRSFCCMSCRSSSSPCGRCCW